MTEASKIEEKRRFAGAKKPSMKRRSESHDYHSRRFYMITLEVMGRRPVLGRLVGNGEEAAVELSPLGRAVEAEWNGIPRYYPSVVVVMQQVMPDHFHGILYVKEAVGFHLGQVIKGFKLGCNRALRSLAAMESQLTGKGGDGFARQPRSLAAMGSQLTGEGGDGFARQLRSLAAIPSQPPGRLTLWEQGYNDKILFNYSTLDKWKAYLRDNPRRLAVRRAHPEYFHVRFGVELAGQTYAAIGNRFLLQHPEKVQVQLSRSLTPEQIQTKVDEYLAKARQGAVLVSPAISMGEQCVMRAALEARLPLIFLSPWGFNTFSKPGHRYYEACAEGRFLILAPWEHQNERVLLTRAMCMTLNRMTEQICNL